MRYFLLLVCISLCSSYSFSQTKLINNLKAKVDAAKTDDQKLAAIVAYCEDYSNIAPDSLEKYAYIALDLATKSSDGRLKSLAWITLAQDYMQWGWTDSTHAVVDTELKKNLITDDRRRDIYFRLKKLKAVAYGAEGRLKECLEVLYPLETEAVKYKDSISIAGIANMIGSIAAARNEPVEARKWNDKALYFAEAAQSKYLGSVFISRAQLLYNEDKIDSALFYLQKGIDFCRNIEMYDRLASAYRFESSVYTDLKKLDLAETALKNMQASRNKINQNPDAIIDDNLQIAEFYANTGRLKKAIEFCRSKLQTGDYYAAPVDSVRTFNNDPASQLPFYLALSRYLKEDKDFPAYQEVLEKIIILKDTLSEINKSSAIAELQTKYDVAHKENTIIAQELKLTQKNYLLYGTLLFIALASVITWLWQRNEKTKQKIKMEQAIEEEQRQSAQSIMDAEEKERKRIAADLHDNIGAYATAIYADVEKITDKGFAGSELQLQNLQQHSREITNSLRDTIWVLNKDNITITGISDRIKNYINKLDPSYENIQIDVSENIENDARVGSQKALNIFRIVQEAIHNALKHSNAKNILVVIESNKKIKIAVKDNGKGMDLSNTSVGNGLRNMQARAKDAGLNLEVDSSPGNGTNMIMETTTN